VDRLQELVVEVKEQEFLVFKELPAGTGLAYSAASMVRGGFIALILLATSACGGGGGGGKPDSAVTPAGAWVELGTGTDAFEAIEPESELVLVNGPQGGHHFILSARMHGLQPGDPTMAGTAINPRTRFSVWNEDGEQLDVDPPAYRLGYEEVDDGVFALPGGHIIQVREEEVAALYGVRVKLKVEIEDAAGALVSDERWVVPIADTGGPGDPDAGPPEAWVEIGTGDGVPFEAIAPESDLVVNMGLQGGHHFFLHARIKGLNPVEPTTRFQVYDEAGTRVDISTAFQLTYDAEGGEVYVLPYGQVTQLRETEVPDIIGSRVRVTVGVTDNGGLQVTDERWVHAVAP